MKRYILIVIIVVSFQIFLSCKQDYQAATPKQESTNRESISEVISEIKLNNGYVLKFYDLGTGYNSFEITHKGQRVFTEKGGRDCYYGITVAGDERVGEAAEELAEKVFDIKEITKDITGDGVSDLIISTLNPNYLSGAYIFTLGEQFRMIGHFKDNLFRVEFEDVNKDNIYEVIVYDWTFSDWQEDFMLPKITYRHKDGTYVLATDLMRKPAPKSEEFLAKAAEIIMKFDLPNPNAILERWRDGVPLKLWGYMLELIYSGNGDLAFDFFNTAWPNNKKGKMDSLDAFKRLLSKSPYWNEIKIMNNWK